MLPGMAWTPGQRSKTRALEQPFEDVPAHLKLPLLAWVRMVLSGGNLERDDDVLMRLRMPAGGATYLMREIQKDDALLLDVVEDLTEHYGNALGEQNAAKLENLLVKANSAYRVRADGQGLEMRLAPGVREQVEAVVAAATGSAGDHLTDAWNEAYSRNPNPAKAYSDSIKAVESALAPIVAPNDKLATLGKMVGAIGQAPTKWEFIIASHRVSGVETLVGMLKLLWDGQTSRHGGNAPTRLETLEEARAAVGIAVTVVQFCASGAFRLK